MKRYLVQWEDSEGNYYEEIVESISEQDLKEEFFQEHDDIENFSITELP